MANTWHKFQWDFQTPLPPDPSPGALAYWIEKSAGDPWTYGDLQRLLGELVDSGAGVPPALDTWAREVAAGRRKMPVRSGPKGDRQRDAKITLLVTSAMEIGGLSQRQAVAWVGNIVNLSPEAILSARRRIMGL